MDIVINIDKNRSARRVSGSYLTHNSDIRLVVSADPESGFDVSQPMSAIVVTCRGAYPPVTASGGVFAAPVLTDDDIPTGARIGFVQGTVRATTPASVSVIKTIEDYESSSADPHANEYDRVISEITLADKILVERASDGYRGAALISALIEYLTEGAEGKSAYELAVEEGYEGTLEEWLASLIGDKGDRGAAGADGFSPTASVVKHNGVITIGITDKNGTTTATLTECDLAFVTTGHSYAQLQTLYEAGKRLVLVVTAGSGNDRYIWLDFHSQPDFIFVAPNGYGYTEYICREAVGWLTVNHDLDSAPAQHSTNPVTSGGIYAALGNKQNTISDLDAIRSGAAAGATAVQPAALTAYRTATAQNAIDEAQDAAIAGKLSTSGTAYKSASIPMGQVDSTSTATAFTATVAGITELRDGVCMWLTNGVATSAEGFTININNLGAKPVYGSLAAATASTTAFGKNYTMLFVYNSSRVTGGCWDLVYGYDTNTTYTPIKLGFGYTTCSTAAATAAKTAALSSYALNTGGIVAIKFTNAVPANATLNINSKGAKAIYHKGAAITAGVIKAGDTVTFMYSTNYHILSIDRWGTDIAAMQTTLDNLVVADNVGY